MTDTDTLREEVREAVHEHPILFSAPMARAILEGRKTQTIKAKGPGAVAWGSGVRRLTPAECERLQGFPDGYTDIRERGKPTPDGPRYKALGNSMAVPCMRWIGKRVAMVDAITVQAEAA